MSLVDELWRFLPHCLCMYWTNWPQVPPLFQPIKFYEVWERWIWKNCHFAILSLCDADGGSCCFIFSYYPETLHCRLNLYFMSIISLIVFNCSFSGLTYTGQNRHEWARWRFRWVSSTSCMSYLFIIIILHTQYIYMHNTHTYIWYFKNTIVHLCSCYLVIICHCLPVFSIYHTSRRPWFCSFFSGDGGLYSGSYP